MELTEEMLEKLTSVLKVEEKLQQRKAEHLDQIDSLLESIEQLPSIVELIKHHLQKIKEIDDADIDIVEVEKCTNTTPCHP